MLMLGRVIVGSPEGIILVLECVEIGLSYQAGGIPQGIGFAAFKVVYNDAWQFAMRRFSIEFG